MFVDNPYIQTLLIVIFAYFIGMLIVNIIDKKLGNISIKMPKISLPENKIIFNVAKDIQNRIAISDDKKLQVIDPLNITDFGKMTAHDTPATRDTPATTQNKKTVHTVPTPYNAIKEMFASKNKKKINSREEFLSVSFADSFEPENIPLKGGLKEQSEMPDIIPDVVVDPNFNETSFKKDNVTAISPATTANVKIGCVKDPDCNIVNGDGRNICKSDGTCHCLDGSGLFCQYGPTNYKDSKDMTPDERERFKYKFRNNMTLQDYKNWLMLYKHDPGNLRQHHRQNLRILLRGGQLSEQSMPNIRVKPPTNAADYFQQMYKGGRISVHFPDQGSPQVGANYTDYSEFVPPENEANSWITGIVDIYKEGKDNAAELNYYLRPAATVGIEERRVGERYLNEVKKGHSLEDIGKLVKHNDMADMRQIYVRKDIGLANFQSKDPNVKIQ